MASLFLSLRHGEEGGSVGVLPSPGTGDPVLVAALQGCPGQRALHPAAGLESWHWLGPQTAARQQSLVAAAPFWLQ